MNHNTLKPNPVIDDYGIDDDQLEYRTRFELTESGVYVASAKQRRDRRECPLCHRSSTVVVHDRYDQTVRVRMPGGGIGLLRVDKAKFYCTACRKHFTAPLTGVAKGASISELEKASIREDFGRKMSFTLIAELHHLDPSYALRLFDKMFPAVPRLRLPRALCIDEILFCSTADAKCPAILYDFETRRIVDLVYSRQKAYLEQYFSKIPDGERRSVRYFISDMYDAYHRIGRKFFPGATYVVDLFHVVELLTRAVSRLRAALMNSKPRDSLEYGFMKSRWRLFQCRKREVPDSYYTSRSEGASMKCFDALMLCLNESPSLFHAWSVLQELYEWSRYDTFTEALAFVERISKRLTGSASPLLKTVGETYWTWRVEIANGLVRNADGVRFSNCVAEGRNSDLKDIKKFSRGCTDFARYRKRAMIVINNDDKKK